jgi:hypothetical protein
MDLGSYVSGLSLALWCAGLPAPLPSLAADLVPHGHDVCMAPFLEHVGLRIPAAARGALERFPGPPGAHQVITLAPRREATGWLDEHLMIGAEDGDTQLQARGQFHPATVHWRRPDGEIGWLRVEHHGPTSARAGERRLAVTCSAHPKRGAQPVRWISNTAPLEVAADRWRLPGLEVAVATTARLADDAGPTYAYDGGQTVLEVRFEPGA